MINRDFVCNRTAEAFLKDTHSHVKMLFGCVGSGKSSACDIAIYMTARSMPKGKDGIRRSKWAVIRNTYSQLTTTTIKTWKDWFPEEIFGRVKGDSPLTHHIKHDDVDLEVVFLSVDGPDDIYKLKSFELTGAYVNEAQFIRSPEIITNILERTNRYPGNIHGGGLGKPLLIMDCNPPSTNHWIYHKFEREKPDEWAIYKMPPALIKDNDGNWINNPEADFIYQVPDPNYWLNLAKGASDEYINVSLCGKYGVLEEGKAVHPEYNDNLHYVNKHIQANPDIAIGLGWDFGNTPACSVVQQMADGQVVVLDEFWTDYMSVREFAANEVIPQLDKKYPFWRNNYISRHDPAGQSMNADGGTCQSILRELGIISLPADSNAAQYRRDAAKYFLTRLIGGNPGFILTKNCQMLREGFMGKFKYEVIKSTLLSDYKMFQPKPLKNIYSHICEALEYILSEYSRIVKINKEDASTKVTKDMAGHINYLNKLRNNAWATR